ncbi:MAG: nitroreductase family protein [Gammaproteobacteria bacterium]
MEFNRVVGSRRSIRYYKTWQPVEEAKIQRILEAVRWTTCPGNLQPWRAIVVYRDELDDDTRELLLRADNWQGAHVQAPVWIYWFGDMAVARPENFVRNTIELLGAGAIPAAYGWAKDTILAAIEGGEETPEGMASIQEILHDMPEEVSRAMAHGETVGACAVATLAAVDAGLGTCLHTIGRPTMVAKVKQALGAPDSWIPVWVQLLGYPAESAEAGGQRPRKPYEELYFRMKYGEPMQRDPKVVAELEAEGLLQAPAPLPGREDELRYLARMYGYPEE